MENNGNTQSKKKKISLVFWVVVFIVFVLVAASCIGVWAYHAVLRRAMSELYDDARVEIEIADPPSLGENIGEIISGIIGAPDKVADEDISPLARINFDLLKQTSPDVYAWIEIPGTDIAFPIVQHPKNNSYYLRKAINGAYDITGCIYTQNYNSKDFSDKNTVVYGHYMDDGTKFGPLLYYMDAEFFENHRRIDVYTEKEWFTYEIFAAVPFNTRHILKSYKGVEDTHRAFLEDVLSVTDARAIIMKDVEIDPENDKILTLSTCLKTDTRRYLVLAKLVKSQLCE